MKTVGFNFTIDFPVLGEWENVDQVRLSLQSCIATLFQNVDLRHTLAMVAGELLENAVKYAHRSDDNTMFRLKIWGALSDVAFVQVANPVDDESAKFVIDAIANIRDAPSIADSYFERMREIASRPSRMSRLGLLRIAYEGGCELSAQHDDGMLTITAAIPGAS
ncbi:MAG TPA: hypothetical protein VLM79_04805 [Kofleriaceae bacterium]|nr:hypothetical protein [Kofleriaceae bacterium]